MDKKILVVSQRFWPERHKINDICEGFAERGCKVDVLCGRPSVPDGEFYKGYSLTKPSVQKRNGLDIYRAFDTAKSIGSNIGTFFNYVCFPVSAWFKALKLRKNRYDAVLIWQTSPVSAAKAGFLAGRKTKAPVTVYAKDICPHAAIKELDLRNGLLKKIFASGAKKIYTKADAVVAENEEAAKYLRETVAPDAGKVHVLSPCPEKILETDQKNIAIMEKYAGSFNFLCIGDITNAAEYKPLLEACSLIRRNMIKDVRVILAGKGNEADKLRKKADKLGLSDILFFEKERNIEKIARFLCVTDVMLTIKKADPTDRFYIPHDVIDSLAAGKPVISAAGSAAKNLIKKAKCGASSEPDDEKGLYNVMMKFYKASEESLAEMGDNADAYRLENHNRDESIDRLLDIMFGTLEEENEEPAETGFLTVDDEE